jgi:hypothetical protein
MGAAGLGRGNAANSGRIAEKFVVTVESCEATLGKPDRTGAKQDLTFASIDKIVATELHSRNYAQTVVKFEAIIGRFWATVESFGRIDAICVVTVATFGAIDATHGTEGRTGIPACPCGLSNPRSCVAFGAKTDRNVCLTSLALRS